MRAKKKTARKASKNEKSFEETLWDTANKLRGSVESSEYKHVVLSLIFLKFVSDKFEERRAELVAEGKEDYLDMVEFYTMQNVFYLPETSRWSYIQQHAKQGDIALKIDSALTDVEKSNASLKGALPDNYFSRLGLDGSKLSALIDAINNIDTVEDKEEDTIEGRNQNDEGRKRSQRTHHAVCAANHPTFRKYAEVDRSSDSRQTVAPLGNIGWSELPRSSSRPEQSRVHCEMRRLTAGTGRIGVLAGTPRRSRNRASSKAPTPPLRVRRTHRHLRHHHQTITGQRQLKSEGRLEKEEIPSLLHSSFSLLTFPVPADTFFKDHHPDLKADYIMANPPFNLKDWRGPDTAMRSSANLKPEGTPQVTSAARNKLVHDGRWNGYETPPTGNANYAWILHMVSKLSDWSGATKTTRQGCPKGERGGANQNGVAGFVLTNGSMSTNTKGEGEIRQKLVENDLVETAPKVQLSLAA